MSEVEQFIKEGAKLLYITAPNCNVCGVLKTKVEEMVEKEFPKIETAQADISQIPELAARFNVFSAPVLMVFFDSQQFIKEGRNVSMDILAQKVAKIYGVYFSK